jgi:hypothetical protein
MGLLRSYWAKAHIANKFRVLSGNAKEADQSLRVHLFFEGRKSPKAHLYTIARQDYPRKASRRIFVKGLNSHSEGRKIRGWEALPENDQDFLLTVDGGDVLIEVTELVDGDFAFPMTREEYNAGRFEVTVQKDYGEIPGPFHFLKIV